MPTVNNVGKPCAGEPHARFDGRELETDQRKAEVAPYHTAELCLDVTEDGGVGSFAVRPALYVAGADVDVVPIRFVGEDGHGLVCTDPADVQASDDPPSLAYPTRPAHHARADTSAAHGAGELCLDISLCPWKIGTIIKAALVILHIEHERTT
jgi:hypothetical protein